MPLEHAETPPIAGAQGAAAASSDEAAVARAAEPTRKTAQAEKSLQMRPSTPKSPRMQARTAPAAAIRNRFSTCAL